MMSRFLKRILLFAILFFVLEKLFIVLLITAPQREVDKRLEMLIKGEMNKDAVIIGSSRGARDIIASQIQDSLGLSCYNLSFPGSDIEFHEFVLRMVLMHNAPPKQVFLVLDDSLTLMNDSSLNFRFDRLYPLASYKVINREMISKGEKSFLSHLFVLSRMNRSNFDTRRRRFAPLDTIRECGSMPVSFQKSQYRFHYDSSYSYDTLHESKRKVAWFKKLIATCEQESIALHLVFPPNYKTHNILFEQRIRQLSGSYPRFIVYQHSGHKYQNPELYYDKGHLKENGAILFTNEIIAAMGHQ